MQPIYLHRTYTIYFRSNYLLGTQLPEPTTSRFVPQRVQRTFIVECRVFYARNPYNDPGKDPPPYQYLLQDPLGSCAEAPQTERNALTSEGYYDPARIEAKGLRDERSRSPKDLNPKPRTVYLGERMAEYLQRALILHTLGVQVNSKPQAKPLNPKANIV